MTLSKVSNASGFRDLDVYGLGEARGAFPCGSAAHKARKSLVVADPLARLFRRPLA